MPYAPTKGVLQSCLAMRFVRPLQPTSTNIWTICACAALIFRSSLYLQRKLNALLHRINTLTEWRIKFAIIGSKWKIKEYNDGQMILNFLSILLLCLSLLCTKRILLSECSTGLLRDAPIDIKCPLWWFTRCGDVKLKCFNCESAGNDLC